MSHAQTIISNDRFKDGQRQAHRQGTQAIINVTNLRLRTFIGFNPEEQEKQQDIIINAEIHYPANKLCLEDNVENALNYKDITKKVIKQMKRNKIQVAQDFSIDVVEVKSPDADAMIVAQQIAEGLERRLPFRRVIKQMLDKVMGAREVKGARIVLAGRLGGNEMARKEEVKRGGIPLQFIRGDVDYAEYRANLPYGVIGIKVWIYKGDTLKNSGK